MISKPISLASSQGVPKSHPGHGASPTPTQSLLFAPSAGISDGPSVAASHAGVTEPTILHGSKSEVTITSGNDAGWELVCSFKGNRNKSKVSLTFGSSSDLALTISGSDTRNRFTVLMDHGADESEIVGRPISDKPVEVLSTDGQQSKAQSLVNPDARRWSALNSTPKGSNAASLRSAGFKPTNAASHSLIVGGVICKAKGVPGRIRSDYKKKKCQTFEDHMAHAKKFYVPPPSVLWKSQKWLFN